MVLVIGHRGAAGYCKGNTRESFEKAIKMNVDIIELDVQITSDGYLVVRHDMEIDHILICEMSYEDLIRYDSDILGIDEVFRLIGQEQPIYLDIKVYHPNRVQLYWKLCEMIEKYQKKINFYVASFDHELIVQLKNKYPDISMGSIICSNFNDVFAARLIRNMNQDNLNFLVADSFLTDKSLVDLVHRYGLKIWPYTANSNNEKNRLLEIGVDGIISDFPDKLTSN